MAAVTSRAFPLSALAATLALGLAACGQNADTSGGGGTDAANGPDTIDDTKTGALSEMTQGSADAPVTVIEYASVTCPGCAAFHEQVYPSIKQDYIDTGKVRFVFREFPTNPEELSVAGSMLARCAADKGGKEAYFLVIDALFKTQREWIYGDTRDELLKIASQVGLDEAAFNACVGRQELVDLINDNISYGRDRYDVQSTPSFIVNGTLRHFSNAADMAKALDEALEKAES
jgi:protein-disulfide isomerase